MLNKVCRIIGDISLGKVKKSLGILGVIRDISFEIKSEEFIALFEFIILVES